jgi:DNA primase
MPGRIPSHFIDDLLNRTDIVDVIETRITLQKKGREYQACCPFHNEKTPSFTVSPEKQFYHCFGCGMHGSAISFLMEYEGLEFVDAIEELASHAGVEVPREAGRTNNKIDKTLYQILEQAAQVFKQQLKETTLAIDYLKSRGLSGKVSADFDIGYALPGWDGLTTVLQTKGITAQQLLDAGLVISKTGGGHYDRFRNRIMFPIRDRRGRVIGFGGRVMADETPKYLNSPETAVFSKGRELYGLYQARKSQRDLASLVVVEGYMDVVSLAQYGVSNCVASLGTAITENHLQALFRASPKVVFCFDGDRAGRQAAWRALELALPSMAEGRQIAFMFLPETEDPDSIIRKEGADGFLSRITGAMPFSEFFYDRLSADIDLSHIDGHALLVEKARPLLDKMPKGVFRHMMFEKLATISRINSEKLSTLMGSSQQIAAKSRVNERSSSKTQIRKKPIRTAIRLVLEVPQLALSVENEKLHGLNLAGVTLLQQLIEIIQSSPHITCGALLERWRDSEEGEQLTKLMQLPQNVPEDGFEKEFNDIIEWLKRLAVEQKIERLLEKGRLGTLKQEEMRELQDSLVAKQSE